MRRAGTIIRSRPRWQTCRGGFTLIEMTVTIAIVSILAVAIGSAILLASHALPGADQSSFPGADGAATADQIAAELCSAVSVSKYEPTAIEFTVWRHDAYHTISYEWSGTAGDPLIRRYDGSVAGIFIESVQEFNLSYTTQASEYLLETEELELAAHHTPVSGGTYDIASNAWVGQYFKPANLPSKALSWRVTRILFAAQAKGTPDGVTRVQLRKATSGGLPEGSPLEEHTMVEADLGGSSLRQFTFSNVSGLDPGEGLCLVLQWVADVYSASVRYDTAGGSGLLVTSNGGGSWTCDSGQSLTYYVYGRAKMPEIDPGPHGRLYAIEISLRTGELPASGVLTSAVTLNQPYLGEE